MSDLLEEVVEAHGGRVFARNRAEGGDGGGGAEVGFELPIGGAPTGS